MKHIVCYSGGHSSALVAIEVVRKYGKENVILINHDINSSVEAEEIIGYSILKDKYLDELEEDFEKMRCIGIKTTEHEKGVTFFARVRKTFRDIESDEDNKPCECVF